MIENKSHSEERHNKLSRDEKSSDGNVKDVSNTTTIEGKPVTNRFPADNEKIAKDVGEKNYTYISVLQE